jgi:hypothetical protein
MNGFPKNVAFHPHGIYIRKDQSKSWLYVVNHAYDRGGERIEVFQFVESEDLILEYQFSIIMGS